MLEFLLGYLIGKEDSAKHESVGSRSSGSDPITLVVALVTFILAIYFSEDIVHFVGLERLAPDVNPAIPMQKLIRESAILGMQAGVVGIVFILVSFVYSQIREYIDTAIETPC